MPFEIFPEYYLIRVNEFNSVAKTPLEEWIKYLKTGEIQSDTKAPGLLEAREKLIYYNMSDAEKHEYDEHINALMIQNDVLDTARLEGHIEGRAEGRAEGREEGLKEGRAEGLEQGRLQERLELARKFKASGIPVELIAMNTGLSEEEISAL